MVCASGMWTSVVMAHACTSSVALFVRGNHGCSSCACCTRCLRFFKRTVYGNYQTVFANGFGALASWGIVMPPGLGLTDDIGVFLAQDVSAVSHWWLCMR